jgi:hypothetical protein
MRAMNESLWPGPADLRLGQSARRCRRGGAALHMRCGLALPSLLAAALGALGCVGAAAAGAAAAAAAAATPPAGVYLAGVGKSDITGPCGQVNLQARMQCMRAQRALAPANSRPHCGRHEEHGRTLPRACSRAPLPSPSHPPKNRATPSPSSRPRASRRGCSRALSYLPTKRRQSECCCAGGAATAGAQQRCCGA